MNISDLNQNIANVVRLFKDKDCDGLKSLLEQHPPVAMKSAAIDIIKEYSNVETIILVLHRVTEDYSRGVDPVFGVTLSKAIYLYSQMRYAERQMSTHIENAKLGALNYVIGLKSLGEHEALIDFTRAVGQWFEQQGDQDIQTDLLLYRIESLVDLARYDESEKLLRESDWQPLCHDRPADMSRRESLASRLEQAKQSATELPSIKEPISDKQILKESRRTILEKFSSLTKILPAQESAMVKNFVEKSSTSDELEKDLPSSHP